VVEAFKKHAGRLFEVFRFWSGLSEEWVALMEQNPVDVRVVFANSNRADTG
jgi:hypothetical protein